MKLEESIVKFINEEESLQLICEPEEWLCKNSMALMFKANGHNVYRLIWYPDSMYLQYTEWCGKYDDGREIYDGAIDLNAVFTKEAYETLASCWKDEIDVVDDNLDNWVGYLKQWLTEAETKWCGQLTEYEKC